MSEIIEKSAAQSEAVTHSDAGDQKQTDVKTVEISFRDSFRDFVAIILARTMISFLFGGFFLKSQSLRKMESFTDNTLKNYFDAELNNFWHLYHTGDRGVKAPITNLLSYGKISRTVCLFHWFQYVGKALLKFEQEDIDAAKKTLDKYPTREEKLNQSCGGFSATFDAIISDDVFTQMECVAHECKIENEYDGQDLFELDSDSDAESGDETGLTAEENTD